MGNKPTTRPQNGKNEDLEEEKSLRIGIGFHKGSARVEGNLLLGCFHKRKRKSIPEKLPLTEEVDEPTEEVGEPPPLPYDDGEEEPVTVENQVVLETKE